jgi:peptidyl-prolyl cis-trans isomerase D
MLTWIREKFGTVLISGIIGLIAFVFVFFGIFSPKNTRGLSEGAVAGTVNGDPISLRDFNQSLQRRMEFYKQLAGGQLTDEQMRAFRLKKMVFEELVQRRLKLQEADRLGMMASDDEVKDSIREIPAFQKDGKFDLAAYKQVLEANNYSPSGFERLVREDQSVRRWDDYFKLRVHVADDEAKREFLSSHDKRNIRYVLLTNENGAKGSTSPSRSSRRTRKTSTKERPSTPPRSRSLAKSSLRRRSRRFRRSTPSLRTRSSGFLIRAKARKPKWTPSSSLTAHR